MCEPRRRVFVCPEASAGPRMRGGAGDHGHGPRGALRTRVARIVGALGKKSPMAMRPGGGGGRGGYARTRPPPWQSVQLVGRSLAGFATGGAAQRARPGPLSTSTLGLGTMSPKPARYVRSGPITPSSRACVCLQASTGPGMPGGAGDHGRGPRGARRTRRRARASRGASHAGLEGRVARGSRVLLAAGQKSPVAMGPGGGGGRGG